MRSLLIKNGTVLTLGESNRIIKDGAVLVEDGIIQKIGKEKDLSNIPTGTDVIDAKGKLIMPGFINQHMHFYSTFARGIIPKQPPAKNFTEILEKLWFPLDKALNEKDIYYSTMVALINGIKNGTTTFFDHHESQGLQNGCLDIIENAIRKVGIRGCLCLGSSDRYGNGAEGIKENIRFINKIQGGSKNGDDLISAMFGLHALFTVNDKTLYDSAEAANDLGVGIHVHTGEDKADQKENLKKYGMSVIERLHKANGLGHNTLAIHCVHVSDKEIDLIKKTGTCIIHNPQSNMNNAVGVANVPKMLKKGILVGLGTDGMTPGMLDDVRVANILHKLANKDPRIFVAESCQLLLENNAKIANRFFPRKIGILEENACADIIIMDYDPPTPLNESTFCGHFLFGICEAKVDTTIINGTVLMKDGILIDIDDAAINAASRKQAEDFWGRF
jgi:putative selenium metabolism protein SsnA